MFLAFAGGIFCIWMLSTQFSWLVLGKSWRLHLWSGLVTVESGPGMQREISTYKPHPVFSRLTRQKTAYQVLGPAVPGPGWSFMRQRGGLGLKWYEYRAVRSWKTTLVIPLWIPFVAPLAIATLTHFVGRPRRRRGHCANCGYNLHGNTSGRCPECGTECAKSTIVPLTCQPATPEKSPTNRP